MGPDILIVLVVVLVIVVIARGPKMLPRIGEALGRTVKTAREEIPSAMKDDTIADVKVVHSDPATGAVKTGPASTPIRL